MKATYALEKLKNYAKIKKEILDDPSWGNDDDKANKLSELESLEEVINLIERSNPPQSEVMTLTQCMDKVASIEIMAVSPNHRWTDWADWHRYLHPSTAQSFKAFREAAELYASQFKDKSKQLQAQLEANTTIRTDNSKVIATLQAELEQVKAENHKLIKDKEIVDFIMDIDWMGTKEFCDKHQFPVPFMVANNPIESARMFIDVDMKRWHVIKDFAKSKRKEALQSTKQ